MAKNKIKLITFPRDQEFKIDIGNTLCFRKDLPRLPHITCTIFSFKCRNPPDGLQQHHYVKFSGAFDVQMW